MGIFEDKKYESLDWMSQAVEPVECDILDAYRMMPDTVEFNFQQFWSDMNSNGNSYISKTSMIDWLFIQKNIKLSHTELYIFSELFYIEVEPNTEINLENKTILGKISIHKSDKIIEEKELMGLINKNIRDAFNLWNVGQNEYLKTFLEILLDEDAVKAVSKSKKKMYRLLRDTVGEILDKDLWRIRSVALSREIGSWINNYLKYGDERVFAKICKLKIMSTKGLGIYSVE